MQRIAVILAGGGGTRFWPLSRQDMPKQLLNFSGNDIMINDTIFRYETVIPIEKTIIVTNKAQVGLLSNLLTDRVPRENVLKEPERKNTAACILYAAVTIRKKFGDAVMAVLPSDHYLGNITCFRETLSKICDIAENAGKLVTIGIKPAFPATGYGYIRYCKDVNGELADGAYEVSEFIEKPGYETAKKYLQSGDYLWNSGIFAWRTSVILDNFKRYLPRLYKVFMQVYEHIGTEREEECIANIYPSLQSISIDYGILERSADVMVVPGDFGWNDVGSWDALGLIFPTDENGNIVKAKHVGIETKNSIIYSDNRLIATIGVDNLIIADTPDAILICSKNRAQNVKNIVDLLKENNMNEYV